MKAPKDSSKSGRTRLSVASASREVASEWRTPPGTLIGLPVELVLEWHVERNGSPVPDDITRGSNRRVWWRCRVDPSHEWRTSINNRGTGGRGCPFCKRKSVHPTNCLALTHPEAAERWHPTKNGSLTPRDVLAGSAKLAWWCCPRGSDHEWQAQIVVIAHRGAACPFCINQRVCSTNSLSNTHPELVAEWDSTRNGDLTPEGVVAGSNRSVWWRCAEGPDHAWRAPVQRRAIQGRGCPFCAGQRVSITSTLAALAPEIAAEWHPTLNGDLGPGDVLLTSTRRAWWKCPAGPDHEWETMVSHRTRNMSGCPFCTGRRASAATCLATVAPDLAAEWHSTKNGEYTPRDVTLGSGYKAWWRCPLGPDHEWQQSVDKRGLRGFGCPFCAGRRVSMTNSLAFVYPALAAEWHPTRNGELRPEDVMCGTKDAYWWLCPRGHEWRCGVRDRSVHGRRCGACSAKLLG